MTAADRHGAEAGEDVVERAAALSRNLDVALERRVLRHLPMAETGSPYHSVDAVFQSARKLLAALAAMPQPPEGYVLVPRDLDAAGPGAEKAHMMGEFTESFPDYDGYEEITVSWTTIKAIRKRLLDFHASLAASPVPPASQSDDYRRGLEDAAKVAGKNIRFELIDTSGDRPRISKDACGSNAYTAARSCEAFEIAAAIRALEKP